jgi:phage tail-like protein
MRGVVPRLASAHPLGDLLPAPYQEDRFALALVAGLDEVLAPIFTSMDNVGGYLAPALAPDDFLSWLGRWVGLEVDERWPLERRRELVAHAADLFRRRGTVAGLADQLAIHTGAPVEVAETGGVAWSREHGAELPGEPVPRLAVRVVVEGDLEVGRRAIDGLVAAAKPAHVVHQVEVVRR